MFQALPFSNDMQLAARHPRAKIRQWDWTWNTISHLMP